MKRVRHHSAAAAAAVAAAVAAAAAAAGGGGRSGEPSNNVESQVTYVSSPFSGFSLRVFSFCGTILPFLLTLGWNSQPST